MDHAVQAKTRAPGMAFNLQFVDDFPVYDTDSRSGIQEKTQMTLVSDSTLNLDQIVGIESKESSLAGTAPEEKFFGPVPDGD